MISWWNNNYSIIVTYYPDDIPQQGQSAYDLATQKKSKWIVVQMDLLARDKGEGKPAFLQSLTKDKVGWQIELTFWWQSRFFNYNHKLTFLY